MYDLLSAGDSCPSGLSIAQKMAGPPIQQQYRTQVYGAQHTNTQPTQPPLGYPSILTGPSYFHFYHADTNVHAPMQSPLMHVVPPRTFSPRINGGNTQFQDQYYNLRSIAHPQTQIYRQPHSSSPVYATPVEAFSLVNDPVFHVSPYLPPAILTAFSDTPNFEPTGPTQRVGPKYNDRQNKEQEPEQEPELCQRLIPSAARKTRPVSYEGDVVRLQHRCREKGVEESVVTLLGKIFADEVSLEALIRPLTDVEVETKEFGIETGKIYTAFLKYTNEASVDPRFICRLCHVQSKQTWKHSKDVLRHLRRDHFGLADVCKQWYVSNHPLTSG